MFSLAALLSACLATGLLTAAVAFWLGRRLVAQAIAREQAAHTLEQDQLRETYARELRVLQDSLTRDVAALQARSQSPLRSLVDSIFG